MATNNVTPSSRGGFPPASSTPRPKVESYDCPPASTGKGGLKYSLRMKAAGTKDLPYPDKTNSLF